jgi:hypothetical protein
MLARFTALTQQLAPRCPPIPRVGKTVGGGYGDGSPAIYVQLTFDAIAAATAALDPARQH